MQLLLDTHVFLWFIEGDRRLSSHVRQAIETEENDILLSIASIWEIAIKSNIGKLTLFKPFAELIPEQIADNEIEVTSIHFDDLKLVETLPLHHRDPFDRLLIAQAMSRDIAIASDDSHFRSYDVKLFW